MPIIKFSDIQPQRKITQLAFESRFSDSEAIAIDLASIGDTPSAALIRRYISKLNKASHVNLDLPELKTYLEGLVDLGLLTEERATAIRTCQVRDHEIYRGI